MGHIAVLDEEEREKKAERLVEMERELEELDASMREDEAVDERPPERPFGCATVIDARKSNGAAVFELELPDGETIERRIRWPESKDPDEPLARLLAVCDLRLDEFANIAGKEVPVKYSTFRERHDIDIPPAAGIGNRILHRWRRLRYDREHFRLFMSDTAYPTLNFAIDHTLLFGALAAVAYAVTATTATLPSLFGAPIALISISVLFVTGVSASVAACIGGLIIFWRAMAFVMNRLFPRDPY